MCDSETESKCMYKYICKYCTLQHTVVGLPVFSPQCLPEARRLHSLITLMDGHLTAAVETRLQWTPERNNRETELNPCCMATKNPTTPTTDQFLIGVYL